MSEIAKLEGVDYVYDSDNWEVTHEVGDIDTLTDDGPTDDIVTVETLISGPTYYAFRARSGSTRIFTTYDECKAASDAAMALENADECDRPMTTSNTVDTSAEAVAAAIEALGDSRSVNGYFSDATLHKFGDMIAALSAALSEARGKVGELEALREQQAAAFVKFAKDRPVAPHPVDQMENLRRAMTTDIEIEKLEAERAAALSELAKLRAEAEWRPIETVPRGEEIFMAATADGRIMIFRGSILANMMKRSTPDHLQFPAVAWKPLPSPPKDPAHD